MQRDALDSLLFVDWVWGYARVRDGETREVSFMAGGPARLCSLRFLFLCCGIRDIQTGCRSPRHFRGSTIQEGAQGRRPYVPFQKSSTSLFLLSCVVVLFAGRREIQLEE